MDRYHNGKLMGKGSPKEYTYVKTIKSFSKCNDLFSRFEQQISILKKLAEATDPATDRHGHDGPSQGLVSKHLENLKLGTENHSLNFVTEWQDGPSQV